MVESLIEYILSVRGAVTLLIIAIVILFASLIPEYYKKPRLALAIRIVSLFIVTIPLWVGVAELQTQPEVTSTEWRTVYTNDIDAQVSLHITTGDFFHPSYDIRAGQDLGGGYDQFERGHRYVTVIVAKNGTTVHKDTSLSRENIIIDGQLSEYAKIAKIEYRGLTKRYKHMTQTSNEIRVTIDGTKTTGDKEELEGLFK